MTTLSDPNCTDECPTTPEGAIRPGTCPASDAPADSRSTVLSVAPKGGDVDSPVFDCPDCAAYCRQRGVTPEAAKASRLRCLPPTETNEMVGTEAHGMLIPYSCGTFRIRLHEVGGPRFLSPAGQPVEVYVPDWVSLDGDLVVVEGPVKAIALIGHGIAAVGLGGTSTSLERKNGAFVLAETWKQVKVQGRRVIVMMDAGRASNPRVARDEARLVSALQTAGACVSVAELPLRPDGTDQGPDDYLATHGSEALGKVIAAALPGELIPRLEELLKRERSPLDDLPFKLAVNEAGTAGMRAVQSRAKSLGVGVQAIKAAFKEAARLLSDADRSGLDMEAGGSSNYYVSDGKTYRIGSKGIPEEIANFTCEVAFEVTRDDGGSQTKTFGLRGRLGSKELPLIDVPAAEFRDPDSWLPAGWGVGPHITPGTRHRDAFLSSVHELSQPQRQTIYAHTGFREIDGKTVYLHGEGAIGADSSVVVDSPKVVLKPLESGTLKSSLERMLSLYAGLAEKGVGLLLMLLPFVAPLLAAMKFPAVAWIVGRTGTLKTFVANTLQSFFAVEGKPLAHWISTPAGLEIIFHRLRHVLVVVDDYAPGADSHDPVRANAERVVRAIGNEAVRSRANADMRAGRELAPQALVLSTGEEYPAGQSIAARLLIIPFVGGAIDSAALGELTPLGPMLNGIMRAYIEFLVDNWSLFSALEGDVAPRRAEVAREYEASHLRHTDLEARVLIAAHVVEIFLASHDVHFPLEMRVLEALRSIRKAQVERQGEVDPARRSLEYLVEALNGPRCEELFGRGAGLGDSLGNGLLGFRRDDSLMLFPHELHAYLRECSRNNGEGLPQQGRLWAALRERGVLDADKDAPTKKVGANGVRLRMLVVRLPEVRRLTEDVQSSQVAPPFPSPPEDGAARVLHGTAGLRAFERRPRLAVKDGDDADRAEPDSADDEALWEPDNDSSDG